MTRVMTLTLPMIQIALFSLQCFCQGQEFGAINGTDRDGNLTEVSSSTSCIKTYDDLESYVKGNRHVIAQLKGAFFVTGRRPSVFVNLTYNFLVLNVTAEHVASCTSNYIWSDQFFYLLGPRPLLWFTLFAVIVREHSATIDLTELFLCSDVYDSLLSRFTYMSKVYAAMDYHEQPLQFINYNYFKVKDANDGVYQNISTLIFSIAQFPLFGMPFISYMTINYIYPKIHYYLKQYTVHMHVSPLTIMGVTAIMLFFCLSIVIYFIGIVLVISHVGSIVEFIDYCNKVLAEEDSNLPYILAGFSSFAIVALFVIATGVFLYKLKQIRRFTPEYFSFLIAASFSVNIIYILCYFSPFMFLAFLHNPLVTFSTYFMVIISIVSFCLITSLPTFYVTNFGIVARQQARVVNRRMAYFISTTTMLVIVTSGYALVLLMMFLGVALLIGNFSNSQSLQTILLSLLLGLISFWILKPIYKKAQREGLIDNENTEEVPEE